MQSSVFQKIELESLISRCPTNRSLAWRILSHLPYSISYIPHLISCIPQLIVFIYSLHSVLHISYLQPFLVSFILISTACMSISYFIFHISISLSYSTFSICLFPHLVPNIYWTISYTPCILLYIPYPTPYFLFR